MFSITYQSTTMENIKMLCHSGILDESNWHYCENTNDFLLFYRGTEIIGAIEYYINPENGIAHIEVIEVVQAYRNQGFGYEIVRTLQKERHEWTCIPLLEGIPLFRKSGFIEWDSPMWLWKG